jgi:KaiC/GvpD/RAD55 family RecA-like ATPase
MLAPDRSFPNGSPVCDYWLSRCEGFTVRAGHRTLGVVETVAHSGVAGHADRIVLKKRHRRRALDTEEVIAVVPARKMLLARRHQHAKLLVQHAAQQVEHGVEVATPIVADIVMRTASAVWRLVRWAAAELRREVPRLVRVAGAEIRERNLQRAAPETGRAHRVPNDYRPASTRGR